MSRFDEPVHTTEGIGGELLEYANALVDALEHPGSRSLPYPMYGLSVDNSQTKIAISDSTGTPVGYVAYDKMKQRWLFRVYEY